MKDISEYFNQLSYFAIINGTNFLESRCNLSICSINSTFDDIISNYTGDNNTRRLNEKENININNYFREMPKINKTNTKMKLRKMQFDSKIYDSNSPPLSKEDIIYFLIIL